MAIAASGTTPPGLAGLLAGLQLAASTPLETAPEGAGSQSSTTGLAANAPGEAAVSTGAVTATATRTSAGTTASSTVDSTSISVLGTTVLTSGVIRSSADCAAGAAPAAATDPLEATVGGATLNAAAGATANVAVTAAGLTGATVTVTVSSPHTTTTATATATGLLAALTLNGQLTGLGTAVHVPLGTVSLAVSSCETPTAAPPTLLSLTPNSGPTAGGQRVTITGSGFTPGTTVTFGGLPGSAVTVESPTSLTVITPAHLAGPAQVVATTAAGPTAPLGYTYVPPTVSSINPDRGPTTGGQQVTITGSGFTPGSSVTIGGHPATGVTVNPAGTQITLTTPPGPAGPATVAISHDGAPEAALPDGYTYLAPPTVTAITPTSGPASGGQTVTITGSGFTPGTTVRFGGRPATDVTVLSATHLTARTPAGAGTVDVHITTSGGAVTSPGAYTYVLGESSTAAPTGNGSGQLPFTGDNSAELAGVGGWFVAAGAWSLLYGSRRRRAHGQD